MGYSYILLDADDTLFDFEKAESFAIRAILKRAGIDRPGAAALYSAINSSLWLDLERGMLDAASLKTRRFELFFKELGVSFDADKAAEMFLEGLAESCFVLPESVPVLKALRRRGRKIAIVTNGFYKVQTRRLQLSGLMRYVDQVVVSEQLGLQKPDKGMIEYALQALNCVDKRDAIMVGDSLSSDMQAAKNAGVDAVWFNPKHKTRPQGQGFYEISRFSSLLSIVS